MCGAWPERSRAFAPPRCPPRRSRARAGRWSGTESLLSLPAGVLWAEGATARPPRSRGRCAKPQLPRAPEHAQRRRVHRRGRDARKSAAFCKIEIAPGRDWHIVPLAGLCVQGQEEEVPLYIHIYIYRPKAKHASSSDRDRAGEHHRPHLARRAARTGIESLDKEVRLP